MVGALRPDTGEELERKVDKDLPSILDALDTLGQGASFVLGHNVVDHDLPILKQQAPQLFLHQLPVIDTLRLSPLAFPQNPYHRLVRKEGFARFEGSQHITGTARSVKLPWR